MKMLEITDLTLEYSGRRILDHINLKGDRGEVLVLTGTSGSGKSSLIRTINGLIPEIYGGELSGSIRLHDKEILGQPVADLARHISTVFQNPKTQFYCVNTTDEMIFALENRAMDKGEIQRRMDVCAKDPGIRRLLDRNIFDLSGGEKQILAVAGAAMVENELYLFDEPSASLDREGIEKLRTAILQLKEKGKLILVAEHRLYYLTDMMDRLAVLENGHLEVFEKKDLHPSNREQIRDRYMLRSFEEARMNETGSGNTREIYLLQKDNHDAKENRSGKTEKGILQCKNFSAKYGKRKIIDGDFCFDSGIYFITGENGVGKTTFINRLAGLKKGQGQVFYKGKRIKKISEILCLVMQDVNYQIFTESIWNEISIVSDEDGKKERILKDLGLYDRRWEHPQILSGGEKQRLMIGLALASEKPVIVLDEPTSGLCRRRMIGIVQYLHQMAESGKTVLVITHDMEFVGECQGTVCRFLGNAADS